MIQSRGQPNNRGTFARLAVLAALHLGFQLGTIERRATGQDPASIVNSHASSTADAQLALGKWLGLDAASWSDSDEEDSTANRQLQLRLLHELPRVPWSIWHPEEGKRQGEGHGVSLSRPTDVKPGQIVSFVGELLELRSVDVPEADRRGLSFDRFFAGTLRTSEGEPVRFAARDVPHSWQKRSSDLPIHPIRCRLEGLCLHRGAAERGPLVVTPQLESRPLRPDPYWGVSTDRVWLAQHGIDLGILEQVAERSPLLAADQAAFYGLISLTARESAAVSTPPKQWDLVALLPSPAEFRGEIGHITGTLRRAVRVVVTDRQRVLRYGLAEYFQLDIFVRTSRPIRYQLPDKSTRDFGTSYPVSICVPTLPADIAEGENLRINVDVPCIFLKLWAHSSDFMALERTAKPVDSERRHQVQQWTPLFIGWQPQRVPEPAPSPLAEFGPGLYIVILVALLGTLAWYFERSSSTRRRRI